MAAICYAPLYRLATKALAITTARAAAGEEEGAGAAAAAVCAHGTGKQIIQSHFCDLGQELSQLSCSRQTQVLKNVSSSALPLALSSRNLRDYDTKEGQPLQQPRLPQGFTHLLSCNRSSTALRYLVWRDYRSK